MQENRSFDQVLGYLSRDKLQDDVDGLLPGDIPRPDVYKGRVVPQPADQVHRVALVRSFTGRATATRVSSRQVSDNMKGFVADYARGPHSAQPRRDDFEEALQRIMDYHADAELPMRSRAGSGVRDLRPLVLLPPRRHPAQPVHTLDRRPELERHGSPEVENPDLAGASPRSNAHASWTT